MVAHTCSTSNFFASFQLYKDIEAIMKAKTHFKLVRVVRVWLIYNII
jgi:hypothetical protein